MYLPGKEELQEIFQNSRLHLTLTPRSPNSTRYGDWESAYLGEGSEFEGFHEFRPGDSRRRIHAPRSSQMGKEIVIKYNEPREARLLIAMDISLSMHIREKLKIAYAAMSMIFASAVDIHMPTALWAFSDDYELRMPFPFTVRHLYIFEDIVAGLTKPFEEDFCVERSSPLSIDSWRGSLPGGSFIFLISDFLGWEGKDLRLFLEDELSEYQVIPVIVQDELEYSFLDPRAVPRLGGAVHFSDVDQKGKDSTSSITRSTAKDIKERNEKRFSDLLQRFEEAYLNYAHINEFDWEHVNRNIQEALDDSAAL